MIEELLVVEKLSKSFQRPTGQKILLWNEVSFTLKSGESIAICGESGSGKSTLLFTLGGLEAADSGHIRFQGKTIQATSNVHIPGLSYIFQHYHLIEELSVLENVLLPVKIGPKSLNPKELRERARNLLIELGLEAFIETLPRTLSGGERQRVAIARALLTQPKLILADEPTGSLDEQTSQHVIELFFAACQTHQASFILVTHNEAFAHKTHYCYRLEQGTLKEIAH